MDWKIYLSGEIHSKWREDIIETTEKQKGEIDEVEYEDFTSSMEVTNGEFCVYDDGEDKDFYGKEILFSDENLSLYVDDPVVDILKNGESLSLVVSDPSQYEDGPFSEIKPAGKNGAVELVLRYEDISVDDADEGTVAANEVDIDRTVIGLNWYEP